MVNFKSIILKGYFKLKVTACCLKKKIVIQLVTYCEFNKAKKFSQNDDEKRKISIW